MSFFKKKEVVTPTPGELRQQLTGTWKAKYINDLFYEYFPDDTFRLYNSGGVIKSGKYEFGGYNFYYTDSDGAHGASIVKGMLCINNMTDKKLLTLARIPLGNPAFLIKYKY